MLSARTPAWRRAPAKRLNAEIHVARSVTSCSMCSVGIACSLRCVAGQYSPLRRHGASDWLIHASANPLEVAAKLRHARVTTTLATHGHLFPGTDERVHARPSGGRSAAKHVTGAPAPPLRLACHDRAGVSREARDEGAVQEDRVRGAWRVAAITGSGVGTQGLMGSGVGSVVPYSSRLR